METKETALILIGYQNDYFSKDGKLYNNIESPDTVLCYTMDLLNKAVLTDMLIVTTPIAFSPDYDELENPAGILELIRNIGAFKRNTNGVQTIDEISAYGNRITEVKGKTGLNAFLGTNLEATLEEHGIKTIALAGAVTSICLDSTGRSAFERGYNVIHLSDCSSARTSVEQSFFCDNIFPIYSKVMTAAEFWDKLNYRIRA